MTASKSCGSIEVVGSVGIEVINGLTGLGWVSHFLGSGMFWIELPIRGPWSVTFASKWRCSVDAQWRLPLPDDAGGAALADVP